MPLIVLIHHHEGKFESVHFHKFLQIEYSSLFKGWFQVMITSMSLTNKFC